MDETHYFIRWRGRTTGPLALERLRHMIAQGRLSKLHDISLDETEWARAGDLDELFPPYEYEPRTIEETVSQTSAEPSYGAVEQQAEQADQQVEEWYYSRGHNVEGPCSGGVINQLVAEGTLTPDDYVNLSSDPWMWKPIRDVPEFADVASSIKEESGEGWSLYNAPGAKGRQTDFSGLATASLVLGLVGIFVPACGIVALVCARKARRGMRKSSNYAGMGLTGAGVVLGIIDIGLDIVRVGLTAVFLVRHLRG